MNVLDMQPDPGTYPDLTATVVAAAGAVREQAPEWVGLVFVHSERCSFRATERCSCRPVIIDLRAQITC